MLAPHHPAPARGALRPIVTKRGGGMRWTRRRARRCAQFAYGKIVWSRSPDAGIKRVDFFSRATVAIKPGHRGERVISRKTIAQGRPECFGVPVFARVLSALISRTRGCGCDVHPAFPAPLISRAEDDAKLGHFVPREYELTSPPLSCPAQAGHPVFQRRLCLHEMSLDYWIARFRGR
jgi:hypothetical protein